MSHPISASLLASSSDFFQIKLSKSVYLIRGYTIRVRAPRRGPSLWWGRRCRLSRVPASARARVGQPLIRNFLQNGCVQQ